MTPIVPTPTLIQTACIWEALARKVGNVHRGADLPGLSVSDFLISAAAIAPQLRERSQIRVGYRIRQAVAATAEAVGQNTNLGIVLLLAPLSAVYPVIGFKSQLPLILAGLTRDDARLVYEAIRLANPGGLGDSPEQDVHSEPTVTLLEAMRLAADRDLIARQYANNFADVFDFGVPALSEGFQRFGCVEAAIVHSQLCWLAKYPDSLIARKNGLAVAEDVRKRAAEVVSLGGIRTSEGRRTGVALDKHLRSNGNKLNPGTTADLIAAVLFVALRENALQPSSPFNWQTEEWL